MQVVCQGDGATSSGYLQLQLPSAIPSSCSRISGIDLTKGNPAEPVIVIQAVPAAGPRTRDVAFDDVRLVAGEVISVDQAENVRFSRVTSVGGSPQYEIMHSANIVH